MTMRTWLAVAMLALSAPAVAFAQASDSTAAIPAAATAASDSTSGAAAKTAAAAPADSLSNEDRAFLERVNRQVIVRVAGMNSVRVRRNLSYATDPPTALADVYLPARRAKASAAPMLLLIHGGVGPEFPVRPREWGVYRSYGRLLAASGFVTVVINHRAGFPRFELEAGASDVRAALRWMRRQARAWGGDPERIGMVAWSGGGPLLVEGLRDPAFNAQALVGVYPILDLRRSALHQAQLSIQELERFSPAHALTLYPRQVPPVMVVRAGVDAIPDLLAGIEQFIANATANDIPLTLVNVPNAPHGFDNLEPTPEARDAVNAMIAFLKQKLAKVE